MTKQSLLFDPDLSVMQYIGVNATFELKFDGNLNTFWVSQKQMAEIFKISRQSVSEHIARFKKDRPEDAESVYRNFRLTASDGKTYDVEHYNHSVVIYIGYRAQQTAEAITFQKFVEEIVRQRFEDEHKRAIKKAQHTRAQDITSYILDGKSQSHAEKRVDMKLTIKRLNAIVMELTDVSMIGRVVGREYLLMFGKVADDLKVILHTKNIRDSLPYLQLTYLDTAEQSLIAVLSNQREMTKEELMSVVDTTIRPLADALKRVCEISGIDLISGKPLLGAGAE